MFAWLCETVADNIWILLFTCLCFLLSKFYFGTRFTEIESTRKETENNVEKNFEKCQSPSCVRCRTHHDILQRARTRLSYSVYTAHREDDTHIEDDSDSSRSESRLYLDLENSLYKRFKIVEGLDHRPTVFKMSGLESKPWWNVDDNEEFGCLRLSDSTIEDIKSEFFELMKTSDTEEAVQSSWKVNATPDGIWSVCHLLDQGRPTKAIDKCPKTWKAVQGMSDSVMKNNLFGNIAFSVIVPGTVITSHYGSSNIRLRSHIGLMIPPGCSMVVNGEERPYTDGDALLFDDSFSHSVKHSGTREDGVRAVLMVDMWHPQIDSEFRHVLNYIFSPDL